MNRCPKIGYVLKRFPRLSETFILNELLQLERLGTPLQIYSLVDVAEEESNRPRHKLVQELKSEVTYLPARQPLKKWHVKQGRFNEGEFSKHVLKEISGGEVPPESILLLQAAVIGCLARSQGVDHLHAHFASDAATVAMLAARLTGLPFSFTAHAKDIFHSEVNLDLLRQKMSEARFVVTVSEFNRKHLLDLTKEKCAEKIIRLYNGIDLERFKPNTTRKEPFDVILAVGRLQEKKGLRDLITACRLLADSGQEFRCEIVGDGPEEESIGQHIQKLGLEDRVRLAGAQPQERVIESFGRATVFVLPCVVAANGDRDALPTALLEAMAAGLPVVSTRLVGIPEIVEHGQTGLLVPPGDPDELSRAIVQILRDSKLQQAFGQAGRARAEQFFDVRENVRKLRGLFESSFNGEKRFSAEE
ncbi:MAG TPA: glycosyltransferase family 4 protein [Verrucomicrobiae bacterium]|nr:glycosyltransferase family 4 protein [Verrucomicrobiae bacterium]